jgi:hypothetical protein
MFNPLLPDLSKLKDQDLENKISDLNRKYFIALRLGQGLAAQQIALNLDAFKIEQRRRQDKSSQDLAKKTQEGGMEDLINVD